MTQFDLTFRNVAELSIAGTPELAAWIKDHRYPVPGHEFTPLFKQRRWDGTWAPGRIVRHGSHAWSLHCSRGLLRRLCVDFNVECLPLGVGTLDAAFLAQYPQVETLRDYQRRALELVLLEGWGRVAFATNAGKGAVIALLAAYARHSDTPALICCDELAVFDALQGELEKWGGPQPALIRSGVKDPPRAAVTLAMIPTLARRLKDDENRAWAKWLGNIGMLLLDEADKGAAATWQSIMLAAKGTRWRAGFSGSFPEDPYRNLRLEELMGPVIDRVTNHEMVERGVSARPTIEVHAFDGASALAPFPKEWWHVNGPGRRNLVYERVVLTSVSRHQFIASLIRPETPTAVVVNRLEHGAALAAAIPGSVFLDGSASETERIRALTEFQQGRVMVLVVTKILDRGTNRLGCASDLIFASGEGSPTQTLQRIGRGLRRENGKEFLRLVDVVDRIAPSTDRRMKTAASFLTKAARKRLQVYAQEGFDLEIKR